MANPVELAAANGNLAVARLVSAANTTNGTNAKASPGRLYQITGYNAAAAVRYIKLYDKASTPTVGTDTPIITIAVAATKEFSITFAAGIGFQFALGIGYGLTTGSADNDTGALTAADIVGLNFLYT